MNLSKSIYCNAIQCKKILWLDKYCKEEKEQARKKLFKYCELDTYAMVKIWQKLQNIIEYNK